jgi:hypothetical protein
MLVAEGSDGEGREFHAVANATRRTLSAEFNTNNLTCWPPPPPPPLCWMMLDLLVNHCIGIHLIPFNIRAQNREQLLLIPTAADGCYDVAEGNRSWRYAIRR